MCREVIWIPPPARHPGWSPALGHFHPRRLSLFYRLEPDAHRWRQRFISARRCQGFCAESNQVRARPFWQENPKLPKSPAEWFETANPVRTSWWPAWEEWVSWKAGGSVKAREPVDHCSQSKTGSYVRAPCPKEMPIASHEVCFPKIRSGRL